ncbi:MAG: hypothetical protein JWN04_3424, partial [Myxococcaceae bacterium]|nr:hypothetical protein [Myxococcaceae bacterium]
ALVPARAYPLSTARPTWALFHEARHALREQAALWAREAGPAALRLLAFLQAAVAAAIAWSSPRLRDLTVRSRAVRARTLHGLTTTRKLASRRFKRAVGSSMVFVRELPVREHARSLLIATLILVAVARADNGTDAS